MQQSSQPASQSASLLHWFGVNAVRLEPAPPAAQLISCVPKLLTSSVCLLSLAAFSVVSAKLGCLRGTVGVTWGCNSHEGVHLVPLSDQFLPDSSLCHAATVAFHLSVPVCASEEIFLSCRYFIWLQTIFLTVTGDLIPQSTQ